MTPVVLVCSPLMVATANGSGKPTCQISMRLNCTVKLSLPRTEDISFVQAIGRNDCAVLVVRPHTRLLSLYDLLVTLRLACAGSSAMMRARYCLSRVYSPPRGRSGCACSRSHEISLLPVGAVLQDVVV